ncbi:MAG: ABC transporter permease [Anaerolineales bacterium]|nr:MAG: ABC transporter permease [Anaerolineales bacterium]
MSIRKIFSVMQKELRHILRDRMSFILVTISPLLLLFTMGFAFSVDIKNVKVAFLDQDKSSTSRRYLAQLESAEDLDLSYQASNYHQIERWFMADKIRAAVIIPQGFKDDLEQGRTVGLQVLIDGTDPNTAEHAIRHIVLPTENFSAQLIAARLDQAGAPVEYLSPIDLRLSTWYNPSMKFTVGIIPALVAVVMSMPAMAATLAITREKERGTLEGLIATPISRSELLVGKLVPYVFTGLLSVVLCVAEAVFIFNVPFQGNLLLYLLLSVDFLFASLSIALMLSAVINDQQAAMLTSMLIFLFSGFFLSGLLLPLVSMGPLVKMESLMLPTTHFVMISRGMFTKGQGLGPLWGYAAALLGMGILFLLLSTLLFKKKLS